MGVTVAYWNAINKTLGFWLLLFARRFARGFVVDCIVD
jgi:hypothetical protein